MLKGERQVQPKIELITMDHKCRYQWVASKLTPGVKVLDAICGIGYGSYIMAKKCGSVIGFDRSEEAIEYGEIFYKAPNVTFIASDFMEIELLNDYFDVVTCFEAIEHVERPEMLLGLIYQTMRLTGKLYISCPNELVTPFNKEDYPFHFRHYSPRDLQFLLEASGFKVKNWYSQRDKVSSRIDNHAFGRTIIAECVKV